jgi:hypothetical protein
VQPQSPRFTPEQYAKPIDSSEAQRYRLEDYVVTDHDGVFRAFLPVKDCSVKSGVGYGNCCLCDRPFPKDRYHLITQGGGYKFCDKCCPHCGEAATADKAARVAKRVAEENRRANVAEKNRQEAEAARQSVERAAARRRELAAWVLKLKAGLGEVDSEKVSQFFDYVKTSLGELQQNLAGEDDYASVNSIELTEDKSGALRLRNSVGDVATVSVGADHLRLVCGFEEDGKVRWQPIERLRLIDGRSVGGVAQMIIEKMIGLNGRQ